MKASAKDTQTSSATTGKKDVFHFRVAAEVTRLIILIPNSKFRIPNLK
jgi:hypothetical protein